MKDYFGIYNIRTRLSAGLFVLAPLLIQLYTFVPAVREISTTTIIILVLYPILNLIIIKSRILGVKAMKKCFNELLPAQEYLLPSNDKLDNLTRIRYYSFFERNVSGFEVKETDNEMKNSVITAITWLIANTRDKDSFSLIAEENMSFGFSYNLLGLKPLGIITSILSLIFSLLLTISVYLNLVEFDIISIISSVTISLMFAISWFFIINKQLVIKTGDKYAKALLSACDSPELNN